ncbi:MAG TPA: corrinoid protein [Anaerolineae bacterium]|nr:corrinoid protein [Anaerolineae bacterium]HOQ97399.1 corrinoid protein [Anaerolineae bacterium]HPL27176.1 corrinoid protein [Anaerolineae bacterium]
MDLNEMMQVLYRGDAARVAELTRQALDSGMAPQDVLEQGLIGGMDRVGKDFKDGTLFVPEVLLAARAMKAGMELLRPALAKSGVAPRGTLVIGTVKGDLHDIGKNLVGMMVEGAGYAVVDLGVDVAPERFVQAAKEHNAGVVGLSALLTTTMANMKAVIDALGAAGLRDKVKVMIGGAPVTQRFADDIGADAFAANASLAVEAARTFFG